MMFSLFTTVLLKWINTHDFKMYRIKYTSLNTPEKTNKTIYKSINKFTNRKLKRNNITWFVFYYLRKNPVG